jgi:hypothetical protein
MLKEAVSGVREPWPASDKGPERAGSHDIGPGDDWPTPGETC